MWLFSKWPPKRGLRAGGGAGHLGGLRCGTRRELAERTQDESPDRGPDTGGAESPEAREEQVTFRSGAGAGAGRPRVSISTETLRLVLLGWGATR